MPTIQLTVDKTQLDGAKLMLGEIRGIMGKVQSRAVNKSLTTVRAAAVDLLYAELNLRKTDIRNSFAIYKASYTAPSGSVVSSSRPVPLAKFVGTRQLARGRGVSVQIKRTGSREVLRHAFMGTMKSGHVGVFERESYTKRPYREFFPYAKLPERFRLPIEEMFSLRITDEYGKEAILGQVMQRAGEVYQSNFEHELDYELSRLK